MTYEIKGFCMRVITIALSVCMVGWSIWAWSYLDDEGDFKQMVACIEASGPLSSEIVVSCHMASLGDTRALFFKNDPENASSLYDKRR